MEVKIMVLKLMNKRKATMNSNSNSRWRMPSKIKSIYKRNQNR